MGVYEKDAHLIESEDDPAFNPFFIFSYWPRKNVNDTNDCFLDIHYKVLYINIRSCEKARRLGLGV